LQEDSSGNVPPQPSARWGKKSVTDEIYSNFLRY
jgi:hypothetical protein